MTLTTCSRCGAAVHRSRLRSTFDRVRCRLTGQVPFRCHQCRWRGWGDDVEHVVSTLAHSKLTAAELHDLDEGAEKKDV